jgi:hypothetical protein
MNENEMGYRGSKSALCGRFAVKEQRADGNWYPSKRYLRCALMGGASYYQVRFLSNQLIQKKLFFSTVSEKTPLCICLYSYTKKNELNLCPQCKSKGSKWLRKSKGSKCQLNPYFVTGFCDGESSFQVSIIMNKNLKLG